MRIKLTFLLFVFLIFNQCVGILPGNTSQQSLNPLAFLFGLLGGSPSSSQNLSPGTIIDLSGDGNPDATLVDSDGDGVSDGISLTGGPTPNLILLDTNGDGIPDAVDNNGDGIADYYISPNPPKFLTTGPGGTGNPVVIIIDANGNPLGFDTDGDGTPNDTAIVTILSDSTPPTITSSLLTGTFSTTQTTTLTCSDNEAPGSIVYTLDASTPNFSPKQGTIIAQATQAISLSTEGSHTLQAICRDLAGNLSTPISIVYTIDTKIPALTLMNQSSTSVSASANAINSSTSIWRTDKDGSFAIREGSSCDSGTIVSSGSATANVDQGFVRSYTHFSSEGTKTFRICVTASNGLTGFVSLSLQRDDTAPVVTANPGTGNYGVSTSITLSCSDTGGSGCDKIAYAAQVGSTPTNPTIQGTTGTVSNGTLYNAALAMSDASVTYTKFVARDKAGNVSNVSSAIYTVDTEVASITVNSHVATINHLSNVSISWQSTKSGPFQIRLDGTNCSNGTALSNSGDNVNVTGNVVATTDTLSTIANSHFSEGDHTIRICVTNLVGNYGSTTRSTKKDTSAPVVTMASPSGVGPFVSGTQLQLSCSDTGGSGCEKIIYTLNGTEPTFDGNGLVTNGTVYSSPVALANGSNQVKYLARDLAGNVSSTGNQSFQVGPPDSPSFVEAQAGGTTAFVQWWPVAGATSYTVYYDNNPGISKNSPSIGPITDLHLRINNLLSSRIYYFRVVANNSGGTSSVSQIEAIAYTSNIPLGSNVSGSHLDASAGQGDQSGYNPNIISDYINQKILITTTNNANNSKPSLFRCELDGSNCSHRDISSGQGISSGNQQKSIIDIINQKLVVVTSNGFNNSKPSLFICDLDGENCNHSDISNGQGNGSGTEPDLTFDPLNKKILVVTRNSYNQGKLSLFKCNHDGNNCTHLDLSSGQGSSSGASPNITLDKLNKKILVVTNNGSNQSKPSLFRCDIDGSNCSHRDISSGQSSQSGITPQIFIDYEELKLMVITKNGTKLSLFRCELDSTNCTHTELSINVEINFGNSRNVKLDYLNRKILAISINSSLYPILIRCNFDGTNCDSINISSGGKSGILVSLAIDPIIGNLLVSGTNQNMNSRPGLFIW
ncbi:chitobiase/beta-hexosaminidase C-terminal domain-containing protein [Leptospira levettii]|uniref:chitobiase/beta-hexosaminidase C-terminal domain-containing protein n=1 Tax=Leptospira levettii TaxID=2023178 RepID=UPI0010824382|nr:chitobiase/beta-hexosaminidase C-terminal domain-containing protein [Leptospira levettii]TGK99913.1 chitobiase [Leptospira levettii]TGM33901.1 chitobiase [Leptospira levettii]